MSWSREEVEALREGWDFEAKRAGGRDGQGKVPDDFWPTYSAMANTQGGCIVLGVAELGDGRFEIQGLGDPERVERELWDLLQNRQKVSANLLSPADATVEEIEGRSILVVRVPRASRKDRPVHLGSDPLTGTYVRVHQGDRKLDRDRVRHLIADALYDTRDDRILDGFAPSDLDSDTLRTFRAVFRQNRPDHPWLGLEDEAFLRQLGGWRVDRESGKAGLTLAGLLMFGRFESIREALPHFFLDYQERAADAGAIEWSDRIYPDGTWSGNLFDFYRRVIPRLTADLRVPFQLTPGLYRSDETHVHEALREALVNCLIHADYEGRPSVLVVKTPSGFQFRNPGSLRLALERIRAGGLSDCRNRTLQQMFLMVGLGERAGSGFSRILRAWEEEHWHLPNLEEDVETEATTLRLSMASLLPDGLLRELAERFGPQFSKLDEASRLAVATARLEGRVTNARLRQMTSRHPRDLTFLLGDLVKSGMLAAHGDRRGTWYSLPDLEREGSPHGLAQVTLDLSQSLSQSDPGLYQSLPQSGLGLSQSSPKRDAPGGREKAQRIAAGRWATQAAVKEAIVELCRGRFLMAREIAAALNRAPQTLRNKYLPELVASGLLELRNPLQPNRADQAYRTADPAKPRP